ncbi:unnamed protein product [Discosporangium mesarthrocarpum]
MVRQTLRRVQLDEQQRKAKGEACNLCGFHSLTYEPMTYYCNGPNCNGKKIRRNSYFYHAAGSNQWHWCQVRLVV